MAETKQKIVRDYTRDAGFYSYNAADVEAPDPSAKWIGREVKRFISQAHLHLPFLLRLASAPPDLVDLIANGATEDGNTPEQGLAEFSRLPY